MASLAAANWYLRELLDCRTLMVSERPAAYVDMWERTDPDHRVARTRAWLRSNRDRADVAEFVSDATAFALADVGDAHTHALWERFACWEVGWLLRSYGAIDFATVHARNRPREIAPGVELVVLDDTRRFRLPNEIDHADVAVAQWLMRHRREGWMLASLTNRLPDSGFLAARSVTPADP
jgi:hypothetical protein